MASDWSIEYGPHVVSQFDNLSDSVVQTVLQRAERLQTEPRSGKRLRGKAHEYKLWSLRIGTGQGEFRLIYQVWEQERDILVIFIGTREDVYNRLERWLE